MRRTRPLAVVLALLIWRPAAEAQTPPVQELPEIRGAVLKGRAPVSEEVLQVRLPRPGEVTLPNGLHVMVLEDRRVPAISLQLLIPGAGGYYDPAGHPGLAGFAASLMSEGTATRSAAQIAEQLETLAATLGVSAGMGSQVATVSASSLTEHFDRLLELLADVLQNPSFPEEEIARFKVRTRAALAQQRSSPGFLAGERFARVIYGDHPAARVAATEASLEATDRDALAAFHRARYVPDHAILGIAGDVSLPDARRKIEAVLGGWKKAGVERPRVEDPPASGKARVHFVDRPGSVQTNLVVGTQAIDRASPDYDMVTVMNRVVGGGPTGRLFMNLREDKGYTYGAYSRVTAPRYRGDWSASTEVRTDVTEPALRELMEELARIRDEPVPEAEFRDVKRSIVAGFALSLESPGTVLGNHITRRLYDLPEDYWDRLPERIMAVTQAQVQAAARRYLAPERLQIVAVGSGGIAELLEQFGPVDRYDTDGRLIAPDSP